MQVTFKLFAGLAEFLPPGAVQSAVQLELPEDGTVNSLIERYHLPPQLVHLVLVNGIYQDKSARELTRLREGDTVAMWPPVAGG
ncbi:MAG: MoaD/ThiS family protein [Arenicellales bacterium]